MSGQTGYYSGLEAERSVARAYLRDGYKFAAHRYRGSGGEIDLIMRKGACVIFIEVKQSKSHARAAERLSRQQMDRIYGSASEFLANEMNGQDTDARFDVALVNAIGEVSVIQNAFAA